MSTKIYTGFKINESNLEDIQKLLNEHKIDVNLWAEKKSLSFIINYMVYKADKMSVTSENANFNDLYLEAYNELLDRGQEIEKTQRRDVAADFDVNIVLFPYNSAFYGIYYSEDTANYKKFLKHKLVEEFSYWNNSDKPKNIKLSDWNERGKIWDNILKYGDIPSKVGFSQTLNKSAPMPSYKNIIKNWNKLLPAYEKRLKDIINDLVFDKEIELRKIKKTSDIWKLMFEIKKDNSEEFLERKKIIEEMVKSKLKKALIPSDFGIVIKSKNKP